MAATIDNDHRANEAASGARARADSLRVSRRAPRLGLKPTSLGDSNDQSPRGSGSSVHQCFHSQHRRACCPGHDRRLPQERSVRLRESEGPGDVREVSGTGSRRPSTRPCYRSLQRRHMEPAQDAKRRMFRAWRRQGTREAIGRGLLSSGAFVAADARSSATSAPLGPVCKAVARLAPFSSNRPTPALERASGQRGRHRLCQPRHFPRLMMSTPSVRLCRSKRTSATIPIADVLSPNRAGR